MCVYMYMLILVATDYNVETHTGWRVSTINYVLTYLPKRIHFSTKVFDMRMDIALMDWVRCEVMCIVCVHEYYYTGLIVCRMRM